MIPVRTDRDTLPGCQNNGSKVPPRLLPTASLPSLEAFKKLCSQTFSLDDCPMADSILSNIPIYDLSKLVYSNSETTNALQDEWHHILLSGPGVLVLRSLFPDREFIAHINSIFSDIISSERASTNGSSKGDHFAASGNNSRIWNSFQKHGMLDPESFIRYYSNPWLALICSAWLGPAYRVTAQVNVVKPGGAAQLSHRDYHLGFQSAEQSALYPRAIHIASQLLTLQGGVAHCDMPLESGPTRFLPFSQMFDEGFTAYRLPDFQRHFKQEYISLPLKMGDAVFFNPATFHAAGENQSTDLDRFANLLQVSSAFGKTMESIDSMTIVEKCWNGLLAKYESEGMTAEVKSFVHAVAEGYPFPLNLDRRTPAPGGMTPESEQDVLLRGLNQRSDLETTMRQLKTLKNDSMA
jgi:ectoine hydroxylase-related dioxygenase (phytanoyl-CoA dioxygenase family)